MTGAALRLMERLDHNDRRLLLRWSLAETDASATRWVWIGVTQLGSAAVTILIALVVPLMALPGRSDAWLPAAALSVSHLVVQIIKRSVQRGRPARVPVIPCPDRFSFPSGHATSSLAIALSLGTVVPALLLPLLVLGSLIGWSRVVLGVHYPGDVLAGQMIATLTVIALSSGG